MFWPCPRQLCPKGSSVLPLPENTKLLTVAEAPALLCFYPISGQNCFLDDGRGGNTQRGMLAVPLAQLNVCSGLS